jgi:tetratricopeptide (TPR) repeat protein
MKQLLLMIGTFLFAVGQYAAAGVPTKGRLDTCVSYYRDGDYQKAADSIKALLPLIADKQEEAEAYKYLGFSYVMLGQTDKAKQFFGVAIEKIPQMTIDTLEVPPNVSNVFKQVRAEMRAGAGNQKILGKNKGRVAPASALTATGAISAGVGGYFLYKGYQAHHDYEMTINDFDRNWRRMSTSLIIGGCAFVFAAADVYFGLRLLNNKTSSKKIGMTVTGNRIAAAFYF